MKWSAQETDILNSNSELSIKELESKLNRTYKSISRMRERLGLCRPKIKGELDHSFFSCWSLPMAYTLGYWFADGCMFYDKTNNSYYFSLSSKDKSHLEKIKKLLSSNHNLQPSGGGVFQLRFASKQIFDNLLELGGLPSKSLILKFPVIPKGFELPFVRGYMDGDGHISVKKNGYPELGFVGTESMMLGISKVLFPTLFNSLEPYNNVYVLRYYGSNAKGALSKLFYNAEIYMERKYNKYLESLKWEEKSRT